MLALNCLYIHETTFLKTPTAFFIMVFFFFSVLSEKDYNRKLPLFLIQSYCTPRADALCLLRETGTLQKTKAALVS